MKVSIICIAYNRLNPLLCNVYSILSQKYQDWDLLIYHDGFNSEIRRAINNINDRRITYRESIQRVGNFGMELRDRAIHMVKGDYIAFTNDDNYYTPRFLDRLVEVAEEGIDFVYCDCVHNYFSANNNGSLSHTSPDGSGYAFYETKPKKLYIDAACFIVKANIAKQVGWVGRDSTADGQFVDDVLNTGATVRKVKGAFVVHN